MQVLIVESDPELAALWRRHLERSGARVSVATTQGTAVDRLQHDAIDVIVLSLELGEGSAFAVADFASYRRPAARVVFVTRSGFFSDGSIFGLIPNTAAFVPFDMRPDDLAAIVEHHGGGA